MSGQASAQRIADFVTSSRAWRRLQTAVEVDDEIAESVWQQRDEAETRGKLAFYALVEPDFDLIERAIAAWLAEEDAT